MSDERSYIETGQSVLGPHMNPKRLFVDERLTDMCVYCGAERSTRDHVPSKALLDEPYPQNLRVVSACEACNPSCSKNEQYVACLIECVLSGSVSSEGVNRQKVRRILTENPPHANGLAGGFGTHDCRNLVCKPEVGRVRDMVLKLARGHVAVVPEVESPLPGLRNEGLFATHELSYGVPTRRDWASAQQKARDRSKSRPGHCKKIYTKVA